MTTPRDPRREDVERRLRESLARQASRAPEGDMLAERIIHAAGRRDPSAERRRLRWAAPVTAAAVLIVLAGVILAITQFRPSSTPNRAADSTGRTVSRPPTATPTPTATPSRVERPSSTRTSGSGAVLPTPTLTNVHIVDLTFSATDSGWALATADCLDGSGGTCTALLHTSDGTSWQPRGGAAFNVQGDSTGCTTDCVTHIRFADDQTGYAYGPSAFFMTTDGGQKWTKQSGGAIALETFNQNVVRLTSSGSGCPGPCDVQVQTADIGSTTWTTRDLGRPSSAATDNVSLSLGGSDAYVLATANPAGGADTATSTLYRSADGGATWRSSGEPCAQVGGEVDSIALAAAPDGRVSVLCRRRGTPQAQVAVSTDHGATFSTAPGAVPSATAGQLTGDPATVLVTGNDGLARSADGGRTWSTIGDVTGPVSFVGFESSTVGRAVTGGDTIWTTRDAGRTWTPLQFG